MPAIKKEARKVAPKKKATSTAKSKTSKPAAQKSSSEKKTTSRAKKTATASKEKSIPTRQKKSGVTVKGNTKEEVWAIIGTMQYGTAETEAIINERTAYMLDHRHEWFHELFDPNEPRFKKLVYEDWELLYILHAKDLARGTNMNLRTAQRAIKKVRGKLKKQKGQMVTVDEFCYVNKLHAKTFRMQLAGKLPPDPYVLRNK